MRYSGRVAADRPDPMETWREQARALGIAVAGLAPQRHLEDWGISGIQSSQRNGHDGSRIQSATLSRMYTVWRNPDNRDDPINLADLDAELRRSLDRPVPDDLPPWIVRQRERLRYPALWEAVHTHWFAPEGSGSNEQRDVASLLTDHVDNVLHNQYRTEHGLGDPTEEHWAPLVDRAAARPGDVIVDGTIADDGIIIDTDPYVAAFGAPLPDGRVITAVIPRAPIGFVTVEFVSDAPY